MFVTNQQLATLKQNILSDFTFNLKADKAKVRHDTMENKEYLVVPCVMMTVGVHAGSNGPLFYPEEELSKTPAVWNYKPVVVYHPQLNGMSISACDPDIITRQKIGVLMNTKWDKGRLITECWLDEEKIGVVDDRVLNAIEKGEMMEVSTGLFTDNEQTEGEWNGEKYKAIARNYRPDHLAILPDQKGACSIEDGAGLLRNAAKEENTPESKLADYFLAIFNELSHNDIWKKLNEAISKGKEETSKWVVEVYDGFFIFEENDNLYYQKYVVKEEEVMPEGVPQTVSKVVMYQLADGSFIGNELSNNKEKNMDKAKIVEGIIGNAASPWEEKDKDVLMGFSEEQLKCIANGLEKKEETPVEPAKPAAPAANKEEEKTEAHSKPVENKVMTMDEYIANAPLEMQPVLKNGIAAYNAQKQGLITKICANQRNLFTQEQLMAKELDELNALAVLAEVPANKPVQPVPHFAGMAEPIVNKSESGREPLVAPTLNFKE